MSSESSQDRTSNSPDSNESGLHKALGFIAEVNAPIIEEEILIEIDSSHRSHREDDALLARFFGICVIMVGVLTVLPAIYFWIISSGDQTLPSGETQFISRWAYIIGFLGMVHVLYGIYIMQLVDYSALQMLSAFLLLVTCIYGFAGMSLLLDDGNGVVATFLQLPVVLKSRAMIWCGIMFGVTAISCYLFGREAVFWRRRQSVRSNSDSGN